MGVTKAAITAAHKHDAFASNEVGQNGFFVFVQNLPDRHANNNVLPPAPVRSRPGRQAAPSQRLTEIDQRVQVFYAFENDVAALAAVTAVSRPFRRISHGGS